MFLWFGFGNVDACDSNIWYMKDCKSLRQTSIEFEDALLSFISVLLKSKMVFKKFSFDLLHFSQSLLTHPSPQTLVLLQMNGQWTIMWRKEQVVGAVILYLSIATEATIAWDYVLCENLSHFVII